MPDKAIITINDQTVKNGNPERTTLSLPIPDISAANVDTVTTLLGSLVTAIAGCTLGVLYKTSMNVLNINPDTASSDPLAQRENKWRVKMASAAGEQITFTIGTADLSLLEANTENMAAGAERTALISALENLVVSPVAGDAMTVQLPITFVGRNT